MEKINNYLQEEKAYSNKDSFPVLLFDDECLVCNRFIQFVLRIDKEEKLYFSSLRSEFGQEVLKRNKVGTLENDTDYFTAILVEENKIYLYSSSILRVFYYLKYPWKVLYLLIYLPSSFRNVIYKFFSKNRKKISFGNSCQIPPGNWKKRLIG